MTDTLIKVENVSKKFCRSLKKSLWYGMQDLGNELVGRRHAGERDLRDDEFWAVQDVSFEVKRGECIGLIGPNGAGKTTLLRMLNGLVKPDRGKIVMRGRVGALIALGAGFNPILTGRENVFAAGAVLGLTSKEINNKYDAIVAFSELEEFMDTPVQNYSSGMQVRLGFSVAAQMEPDILLLDEVLAVGDAQFQVKCINVIRKLTAKGVAVILVSHNMINILRFSDLGLYLRGGVVREFGPIVEVSSCYLKGIKVVSEATSSGNVPTDSGIALDKVFITDDYNNKLGSVLPTQNIHIHVPYVLEKDFPQCEVALSIGIYDFEGLLYNSVLSSAEFRGGLVGSKGEFIVSFNGLLASSGTLVIGVSLWLYPDNILLAWSRENNVLVKQVSRNAGRIELTPVWSISYDG